MSIATKEEYYRQLEILRRALVSGDTRLLGEIFGRTEAPVSATLVRLERGRIPEEPDLETRVSRLEKDVKDIKEQVEIRIGLKTEALGQFKDMISKIPEVREAYYRETEDGFDFWTLFESTDRIRALKNIVQVQVELDRTFKDVYFDFLIDHLTDVDRRELQNWNLIYRKD